VNVATATGTLAQGGGTVTDSDPAHWLGVDEGNASIGNYVWDDRDRDGIQDKDEKGIKGVVVHLLDQNGSVVDSSVTDSRGFYRFTGLDSGTYTVAVAQSNFTHGGTLSGWEASPKDRGSSDAKDSDGDPITHRSAPVTLAAAEQNRDIDFGFRKRGGHGQGHDCEPWGKDWKYDNHDRGRQNAPGSGTRCDPVDWSGHRWHASLNPFADEGRRASEWTGWLIRGAGSSRDRS
jgi:hypothetical protein